LQKEIELVDDGYTMRLDISRFVPLGFGLMAIGIKANKVLNALYRQQNNRT